MDILKLKENMTQEQLAEHLGVSRAKVCHLLRKARKSERIEYQDRKEPTEEDIDSFIDAMKLLKTAQDIQNEIESNTLASIRLGNLASELVKKTKKAAIS